MAANKEGPELIYPYLKLRKDFGRQCQFLEDHGRTHINILPNRQLKKKVRRYKFVDREIQACHVQAESEMNTVRAEFRDVGMRHEEGGWPKDVDMEEPEMISRYRKKLEKDDTYQSAMQDLTKVMEKLIKQNNALDIYGELFDEPWEDPDTHKQPPFAHVVEVYRDPTAMKRAISKITWAPDNAGRVGICHCPFEFDSRIRQQSTEAFLWDLENSSRPEGLVRAGTHIVDMRYNPKDAHKLIGGCFDGSVCLWDVRVGASPVGSSLFENSHQDVCTGVIWINSKTGSEFFSAGLDGQVIWWDDRKLSETIETTWLDPEKGQCRPEAALGASCLEYEHTLPTKFMAGTETGQVMIMMRKGKTPNDKLVHVYRAHHGPIRGLQRNPTFIKNFLTVGDHTCRIFAEDCRESSILWTAPKGSLYSHGAWIPTRASCFCCSSLDGNMDFWDMLMDPVRPHLTTRICDDSLTTVSPSDSGKFVAVGTDQGYMSLVKLADSMTTSEKADKPALAAVFERESRREKVLEQRNREMRLRKRDKEKMETEKKQKEDEYKKKMEEAKKSEKKTGKKVPVPDYSGGKKFDVVYDIKTDPVVQAEKEFFQSLRQEMESAGVNAFPDKKIKKDESGDALRVQSSRSLDLANIDLSALNLAIEDERKSDAKKDSDATATNEAGVPSSATKKESRQVSAATSLKEGSVSNPATGASEVLSADTEDPEPTDTAEPAPDEDEATTEAPADEDEATTEPPPDEEEASTEPPPDEDETTTEPPRDEDETTTEPPRDEAMSQPPSNSDLATDEEEEE